MVTGVDEDCNVRACRPPDIREFPPDIFTQEQRFYGGVALHLLFSVHIFCALTVVCEDYFVASLNRITACLKLEPDVAGATFMAVGSSAPTLFISIISIFFTEGDIGLGTIVGSTIFNTLFIISLCGCAVSVSLKLLWYPIIRDSTMYMLSVLILIVTLYDQRVHWYEGLAFVFSYSLYIVVICNNSRIEAWCFKTKHRLVPRGEDEADDDEEEEYSREEEKSMKAVEDAIHEEEASPHSPLKPPCGTWARLVWLFTLPSIFLFYVTIPDCRQKQWKKFYLVTFTASTLWMGLLSYFLVWMVAIIGYTYSIPECAMGMTFLAAGSSLPDAISSLIVVRQGNADMAVSNCIGSNVFDMLCLGIPWLLKTTVIDPNSTVRIQSENIFFITFILLASIVVTVLLLFLNKWKLDQKIGVIFLVAYLLFLGVATFIETLPCCF